MVRSQEYTQEKNDTLLTSNPDKVYAVKMYNELRTRQEAFKKAASYLNAREEAYIRLKEKICMYETAIVALERQNKPIRAERFTENHTITSYNEHDSESEQYVRWGWRCPVCNNFLGYGDSHEDIGFYCDNCGQLFLMNPYPVKNYKIDFNHPESILTSVSFGENNNEEAETKKSNSKTTNN